MNYVSINFNKVARKKRKFTALAAAMSEMAPWRADAVTPTDTATVI